MLCCMFCHVYAVIWQAVLDMRVGMHMQDYWHHWEDVTCGFLLGVLCAFASYRQHYPSIAAPRAGEAYVTIKGRPPFMSSLLC